MRPRSLRSAAVLLAAACVGPRPGEAARTPADLDRDGFPAPEDCDDTRSDVHPGAPETWYDGLDADCAGDHDSDQDGDGELLAQDCDDADASRNRRDIDGDRVTTCHIPPDCDDANPSVRPGAPRRCGSGEDSDCDGRNDCLYAGELAAVDIARAEMHPEANAAIGYWIAPGDLNDDGVQDVAMHQARAVGSDLEPRVAVVAGPFSGPMSLEDAFARIDQWSQQGLIAADLTLDGRDDLLLAQEACCDTGGVWIYPGPLSAVPRARPVRVRSDGLMTDVPVRVCDVDGHPGLDLLDQLGYDLAVWSGPFTEDRSFLQPDVVTPRSAGTDLGRFACAGDLNGDGATDVTLRDYRSDTVRVLDGPLVDGVDFAAASHATVEAPETPEDHTAGDLDGDGYDDLVVTLDAWGALFLPWSTEGDVFVVPGPVARGAAQAADTAVAHVIAGMWLYQSTHVVGDLDGDGAEELLLEMPTDQDGTQPGSGRAWLFYGPISGLRVAYVAPGFDPDTGAAALEAAGQGPDAELVSGAPHDGFGTTVQPAGDMDGDGASELWITASGDGGVAWLIPGTVDL